MQIGGKMNLKYFIEVECGGRDAAGGGCGAPLDFYEVEASELVGKTSDRPRSHNRDELPKSAFDADGELRTMLVSLIRRPCWLCRKN